MLAGTRFSRVRWTESTGSTNDDMVVAAAAGEPEQVAITDLQTAGRGRRARTWHAPPRSSAMFSVLLRGVEAAEAFWKVGAVSLAAVEAARAVAGVDCTLKWPNDVMIGDRKVAGVLAQRVDDVLVVGMGMNVNWPNPLPEEIAARATSLNHHVVGADTIGRAELIGTLLADLAARVDQPSGPLRDDWVRQCSTIGSHVRVETAERFERGVAVDVTIDGALVVDQAGVHRTFHVGDVVHVRPQD